MPRPARNRMPLGSTETPADGIPTPERIRIAGEDGVVIGGEKEGRSARRYVMRDSPLDRALNRRVITGAEHSALQKYRHHWYHGGQAPHVGSVDLNRIFSSEGGNVAGMPASEAQVFHRQRWREAREMLGHRSSIVIDNFVCSENSLEICGYSIGWNSKPQAIAVATEIVKDAAYRLAKLWGIG